MWERTENHSAVSGKEGAVTQAANTPTHHLRYMGRKRLVTRPPPTPISFYDSFCPLKDDFDLQLTLLFHLCFSESWWYFSNWRKDKRNKKESSRGHQTPTPRRNWRRPGQASQG